MILRKRGQVRQIPVLTGGQVNRKGGRGGQTGVAVFGLVQSELAGGEDRVQETLDGQFIVDNQDPGEVSRHDNNANDKL